MLVVSDGISVWSTGMKMTYKKGNRTMNFAAAAGLTYFLPLMPPIFLKITMPMRVISATYPNEEGPARGIIDPSIVATPGTPIVYESATIMPKTAADRVFIGLSAVTTWRNPSIATAIRTATTQFMATASPRFMKGVLVMRS